MKKIILSILLILLIACSADEVVIDNFEQGIILLTADDIPVSKITKHNFSKSKILNADIYSESNQKELSGEIDKIASFRNDIFVILGAQNRIKVLDAMSYKEKKEFFFDFGLAAFNPQDICFPNATDAYLLGKNQVMIIDLTVYEPALVIDLPFEANMISCLGNQVFVAHTNDNSVSFIDTRTRNVTATINVNPRPVDIDILPDGKTIGVLCAGNGKIDDLDVSAAYLDYVDIFSQTPTSSTLLNVSNIDAFEINPYEMVITPDDWAYIASEGIFFRVDMKDRSSVSFVNRLNFRNLQYSQVNDMIFVNEKTELSNFIYSIDSFNGNIVGSYEFNGNIKSMIIHY